MWNRLGNLRFLWTLKERRAFTPLTVVGINISEHEENPTPCTISKMMESFIATTAPEITMHAMDQLRVHLTHLERHHPTIAEPNHNAFLHPKVPYPTAKHSIWNEFGVFVALLGLRDGVWTMKEPRISWVFRVLYPPCRTSPHPSSLAISH